MAGVITGIRTQMTQRGKMLIVLLDDGTGQIEMTVFNELFDANRHMFREDELLIAQGNARHDTFTGGVRFTAESVMDLVAARAKYADAVCLGFNGNASTERLRELLTPYLAHTARTPGVPVRIRYVNKTAQCEATLGDQWQVTPSDDALTTFRNALGDSVRMIYG
ncbi:DNA polymerase III subunit alpha [compost metagenome]